MKRSAIILTLFVSSTTGFKFMANWKVNPSTDPAHMELLKERFGDKKLAVVTGTSSGLGRKAALALLRTGEYHVIGAVRDLDKMEVVAEIDGFDSDNFTPMYCELNSFESVKSFCRNVEEFKITKPIDRLICNAGVYQPTLPYAKWSVDGHEQTMQINYLSHLLMVSELLEDMSNAPDPRVIMVGSVTGNDNTVGGGGVYPIADLKTLDGFAAGFDNPVAMADGYGFDGAKAYKDSKLCLMMISNVLHAKYHKLSGVTFSSIYPGCIAESPLFREKRKWFRKYFPIFMKFITGGFVSEQEAGQRLFQVAHDPRCNKSGVYWSWNGGPRENRGIEAMEKGGQISGGGGAGGGWDSIYENDQSAKVNDIERGLRLFNLSTEIIGAEWPFVKQVTSPCPTLNVIGALSKAMIAKEELKRMEERPGFNADGTPIRSSKAKRAALVADKVVGGVLKNTLGRVGRFAGRRILGRVPQEAIEGSYQDEKPKDKSTSDVTAIEEQSSSRTTITTVQEDHKSDTSTLNVEDQSLLEREIAGKIFSEYDEASMKSDEDLFNEILSGKDSPISQTEADSKSSPVV